MKQCSKCGEVKALEAFCLDRRNKDGTTGDCRCCRAATKRAWVDANRDRVRAYARQDRVLSKNRAWKSCNKEKLAAYQRDWYALNRDHALAYAGEHAKRDERKAAVSEKRRRDSASVTEAYTRRILSNAGINPQIVPGWVIDAKREQLRLKRLAKELNQAIANHPEKQT